MLLLGVGQSEELARHAIRLGTLAGMLGNRLAQVGRAPVVQEEQALPETPQRRAAPFSAPAWPC